MWIRASNKKLYEIVRTNYISDKDYYKAINKIILNKEFPKLNNQNDKILQVVNNDIK